MLILSIWFLFHVVVVVVLGFHLVGVIWTGRWAGERKERISEVTLYVHALAE